MPLDSSPGIEFFDANAGIGRPGVPKYRTAPDADALESGLGGLGITGALVRHSGSFDGHPTEGNELLHAAIRGRKGLEPVWAVMPHWTGEFPAPDDLLRDMASRSARAAVAYPLQHGFALRATTCGELLAALERCRVPLFLPAAQVDLGVLEGVLDRHPRLPLILSDTSYRLARDLYPLLDQHQTLYLEISGYMVHRGIEDICRHFGPERLLFGTRFPLYNPGCAVAAVLYADVAPEAKALIASGNLRRLLGEVRLP